MTIYEFDGTSYVELDDYNDDVEGLRSDIKSLESELENLKAKIDNAMDALKGR